MTAADLKTKVVDGYADTGGAFWWSLGDHEVYQYETERGEIFGQGRTSFDDGMRSFVHSPTPGVMPRIAENLRALIAETGGPLTTLTRLTRSAGLPFFPRVRMNSHYDMDPDHPAYGRFRREHPELMIGRPGESIPEGTIEWGIRTGLDFAHPVVRAHRLSIVEEVVERFDVDGVELDFMRHPAFFRPDEAYGSRYLMTDLVARARRMLDEAGSQTGQEAAARRAGPSYAVRLGENRAGRRRMDRRAPRRHRGCRRRVRSLRDAHRRVHRRPHPARAAWSTAASRVR